MPTGRGCLIVWMIVLALGVMAPLGGCARGPSNPSFAVTSQQARTLLRQMRSEPRPLARPVVVLAGWMDPGLSSAHIASRLRAVTDDDRIISVSFVLVNDFDDCRERLIAAVDEAMPIDDPLWTQEVDVVAVSMGGLVARYAATEVEGRRRLHIARLFTIATPHLGAAMAEAPGVGRLHKDMRPNSAFIEQLNADASSRDFEIVAYVRLYDQVVGVENAAPQGVACRWVPNQLMQPGHGGAFQDPRILADIALRLRGQHPLSTDPPAPLPDTINGRQTRRHSDLSQG